MLSEEMLESRQKIALNYLLMEIPALKENVGLARVSVAAFIGQRDITLSDLEEIKQAVSEAVTNCVVHAYQDRGIVTIRGWLYEDSFELAITDSGKGIEDIDLAREVSYSTVEGHMGLGFLFMESFMDSVEVFSVVGQGTTVLMRKYLHGSGEIANQELEEI